jgi:formylmethanofuran--tetrahydromethanopterin N-formyltransferase
VYEIVIDGLDLESLRKAMAVALEVAREQPGIVQISAGNYGGKLGPFHIHLRSLDPTSSGSVRS